MSWVRRFAVRPQADARLFCFSYAGAGASVYRLWHSGLPAEIDVCAVQLPGRETRLAEPALTNMNTIVAALVAALRPELDRPFAFFGHSMGAVVACELAHALRAAGLPLPRQLIVSGRRAPQLDDDAAPLHPLPDAQFIAELNRRYGGIPAEVMKHQELLDLLLPCMRADLMALETHRAPVRPPLPVPIAAFGGLDDARVPRGQLDAWREQTSATFRVRMFQGDHFFLNARRTELLADLGVTLAALLTDTDSVREPV
jgi:surfactin synthase thioesterase subunit